MRKIALTSRVRFNEDQRRALRRPEERASSQHWKKSSGWGTAPVQSTASPRKCGQKGDNLDCRETENCAVMKREKKTPIMKLSQPRKEKGGWAVHKDVMGCWRDEQNNFLPVSTADRTGQGVTG